MKTYLGIDVGGTNLKYALMDEDAGILEKGEIPTPADSLNHYIEALVSVYRLYPGVEAVVMSAPGRIDPQTGFFYSGGSLYYVHQLDLSERLKPFIPVPFCAENDAKSAALAELWKGSMRNVKNGIIITLGTGVGGGIILDGKLYRGSNFAAGELSCVPRRLDRQFAVEGMLGWSCGLRGIIDVYAAKKTLDREQVNGKIFFSAVKNNDPQALNILKEYCREIANSIVGLQGILDVEKVAIGGGISAQPILIETIREQVNEIYDRMPGFFPAQPMEITRCTFGNDANLIGALYHYLYEIRQ